MIKLDLLQILFNKLQQDVSDVQYSAKYIESLYKCVNWQDTSEFQLLVDDRPDCLFPLLTEN